MVKIKGRMMHHINGWGGSIFAMDLMLILSVQREIIARPKSASFYKYRSPPHAIYMVLMLDFYKEKKE